MCLLCMQHAIATTTKQNKTEQCMFSNRFLIQSKLKLEAIGITRVYSSV